MKTAIQRQECNCVSSNGKKEIGSYNINEATARMLLSVVFLSFQSLSESMCSVGTTHLTYRPLVKTLMYKALLVFPSSILELSSKQDK